jgi:hypothetical protein
MMKPKHGLGWAGVLCALILSLTALPALAQGGGVSLASLRVGLWPEYDRPEMLAIYWGEVDSPVGFPVTLSLHIPEDAELFVVAAQPARDAPVDEVTFENTLEDGWRVIRFEVNGPLFQFEYYTPIPRDGSQRAPLYVWPGDYPVEAFSIELQQPPHSSDLKTSPALPSSEVREQDNLIYLGGQFGPLADGQEFTLEISYTRDSDELTADLLSALAASSAESTGSTSASATLSTAQPAGRTDIVLIVAVAVVFFLLGAATMRIAINLQGLNRRRGP